MLREIRVEDLEKIKQIHERYYASEFGLPDFSNNFLCAFVVVDEQDNIISAAGIRTIVELVGVTDKSINTRTKLKAYNDIIQASSYVASRNGYDQLHAFIQEPVWMSLLTRHLQWRDTAGKSLVLDI